MRKNGFSLVELSIVLVILGLLTGGILAGQSLIRAAELRSSITQFAQYRAAAYSFRDKYFALPGDMANATAFWTSAGGTGADAACIAAQTTAQATCNGNGDGLISSGAPSEPVDSAERFMAWKHLANAGLVEGSYTGKTAGAAGTYVATAGSNVARARISSSYFDYSYIYPNPAVFNVASKMGVNSINIYGSSAYGAMTPEEAWNTDTKLDDASPVYGSMYTTIRSIIPCASSDAANATYDFTQTAKNCMLVFLM